MDKVRAIDLSSNNFNGEIPPTLGSCEEVELINLSRNAIRGTVPGTLGSLVNLKVLDLSSNLLSGDIPSSLQKCDSLIQLNISFNNFSGPIPTGGIFDILTVDSFEGNPLLCGRLTGIPTCHSKKNTTLHSGKYLLSLVSVISTLAFVITICCVVGYQNIRRRSIFRRKEGLSSKSDPELRSKYPRITYRELVEATNGFEPSKLIGSGGYGRVYKGVFGDGSAVAKWKLCEEFHKRMPDLEIDSA
ncbi:Protein BRASSINOSTEROID INSENSITIVE 1 [Acorus calamus]|nr:Protein BRASSINOSTEROID INSENSITIVE 1 [Acorus calamus]